MVQVQNSTCKQAERNFQHARYTKTPPRIHGEPVSLEEAIHHAAAVLGEAKNPLFAGLATDARGIRATLKLAWECHAIVDHLHGEALQRNYQVLQESGWITTTLSEIRNRADLVVFIGTDGTTWPRFHERILHTPCKLFPHSKKRRLIYLGEKLQPPKVAVKNTPDTTIIPCPQKRLPAVLASLRALLNDYPPARNNLPVPTKTLHSLAAALAQAEYGVFVWDAGKLGDTTASISIQSICELVRQLNRTQRFAGFPLGGNDGATTAGNICAWQNAAPLRMHFQSDQAVYDPYRYTTRSLLSRGSVDALLWISSIGKHDPPEESANLPSILLCQAGYKPQYPPTVQIPVATPGIDHSGHLFRGDSSVMLRLQQLRPSLLPTTATVIQQLHTRLHATSS